MVSDIIFCELITFSKAFVGLNRKPTSYLDVLKFMLKCFIKTEKYVQSITLESEVKLEEFPRQCIFEFIINIPF